MRRASVRPYVTVLGIGFLVAAAINLVLTLPSVHDLYWPNGFAPGTWLPPYRWLEQHVVGPNALVFTIGLITLECMIGIHLLMGDRRAEDGLAVGTVFALVLVPALPFPVLIANVALAALMWWMRSRLRRERLARAESPAGGAVRPAPG